MKREDYVLLTLIVAGCVWRILSALHPAAANYVPVTALAFCGTVFFRGPRGWFAAGAVLVLSDLWINHLYATRLGYTWDFGTMLLRIAALGIPTVIGTLVARHRSKTAIVVGTVGSTLAFYVLSNTAAWAVDPFYQSTFASWIQALTTGHPEWPPTWLFLRNAMIGDLGFTLVCLVVTYRIPAYLPQRA